MPIWKRPVPIAMSSMNESWNRQSLKAGSMSKPVLVSEDDEARAHLEEALCPSGGGLCPS